MKVVINNVNYGNIIYHFRMENNMTQWELCEGICSVTYLSKIENNKNEPNSEIVKLLLARLDIDLEEMNNQQSELQNIIESLYQSIVDKDGILSRKIYQNLLNKESRINNTQLLYYKQLVLLRFYLYIEDFDKCNLIFESLNRVKKNLNPDQFAYYQYFTGIFCCLNFKHKEGLKYMEDANLHLNTNIINSPELLYHLSLTYMYLFNTSLALYNAEKALESFNKLMNYERSIECQLIIGVINIRIEKLEAAKIHFKQLVSMSKKINNKEARSKSLHNLGFIYSLEEKYNKAKSYYLESLTYLDTINNSYLNTVLELSKTLYKLKENELALQYIDKGLDNAQKYNLSKNYIILFNILKYEISREGSLFENYLIYQALPYYHDIKNDAMLLEVYHKLSLYYEQKKHYKKSSKYYALALKIAKTIK